MESLYFDLIKHISELYSGRIMFYLDVNNDYVIFIQNIERIKRKKYISNLEGRGSTLEDACERYIHNALNTDYNLRYKHKFYVTTPIRNMIKKSLRNIKVDGEYKDTI